MADIYSKPGSISGLARGVLMWTFAECCCCCFFGGVNHDRLTSHESLFSAVFGNEQGNKNRLLNILMNLRKCVNHPYLFNGETCSVVKWMLNKISEMSKHVLHFNVPLLFVRGGTGAFRDGGASHWGQWETLPFGQHADLPSQRVSTCCWAPPGGSLGSCLTFFFFPSLSSCSLVKGPPDPAVLSDDEDAGHTSGLHGVQRWRGGCPGFVTPTGFSDFKNITINFDSSFLIVSTTYYTLHSFETSRKLSIMFPGSWREMFNGMFFFSIFSTNQC